MGVIAFLVAIISWERDRLIWACPVGRVLCSGLNPDHPADFQCSIRLSCWLLSLEFRVIDISVLSLPMSLHPSSNWRGKKKPETELWSHNSCWNNSRLFGHWNFSFIMVSFHFNILFCFLLVCPLSLAAGMTHRVGVLIYIYLKTLF